MILSPSLMADLPQTWDLGLPPAGRRLGRSTPLRAMPNLTVFDTGLILAQIQAMLGQVVKAVQFLFVLTLAAGITVLYGALASSRDERMREAGLMRALGASSRQLSRAQSGNWR
ncbi:MAG: FtsX-like permease family protein [Burkholderiaceae bacterium]